MQRIVDFSFVRGNVGFESLKFFSRLRHLDISFTAVTSHVIQRLCSGLKELTHLDVSGTTLTWSEVFTSAANLTKLKHLGMCHLSILGTFHLSFLGMCHLSLLAEREEDVLIDIIGGFLLSVQTLTSLDVSSVKGVEYGNYVVVTRAMEKILEAAPKTLTRLVTSFWFSHSVLHRLGGKINQLETVFFVKTSLPFYAVLSDSNQSICKCFIRINSSSSFAVSMSDVDVILSEGISLMNRIYLLAELDTVCSSLLSENLISDVAFSNRLTKLLDLTSLVVQVYVSADKAVLSRKIACYLTKF